MRLRKKKLHASAKTGELAGLSGVCVLPGEAGRPDKQLLTADRAFCCALFSLCLPHALGCETGCRSIKPHR